MKTKFFKSFAPALALLLTMTVSLAFTDEGADNDAIMQTYYYTGSSCDDAGQMECTLQGDYNCTAPLLGQLWKEPNGTICQTKLKRNTP